MRSDFLSFRRVSTLIVRLSKRSRRVISSAIKVPNVIFELFEFSATRFSLTFILSPCNVLEYEVVTNALFLTSCELLELTQGGNVKGTLGLFSFNNPLDDVDECVAISDIADRDIDDKAFKCAQVCSIMSFVFGGVLLVYGFFKQCLCPLPCTQLLMDISSTGVQICLALVYVIWLSEACDLYKCISGDGVSYLVCTQILWLIAGCFSRCMREGRSERHERTRN